ncbi:hypothetical protein F0562_028390 [Nyssa sinensis]|uniref:Uncharacterized protein n=1 Tax=Nyssa sinensis TaxID=561372 RepID=A0A5J5B219_9ASTE|nr:hypothetical protein F0562_028390 [Nyssa sinensis]
MSWWWQLAMTLCSNSVKNEGPLISEDKMAQIDRILLGRAFTMSSIFQSFHRTTKQALPVSQPEQGLRRRLSYLSSSPAALRRSKSVSSMEEYAGSSIRKWWDWGWSWILSRKPTFARDLEMNGEETTVLGGHNKGSWRHVFYKVRSEVTRIVRSSDNVGLPQTFRYDSFNYSQNFDDGKRTTQGN